MSEKNITRLDAFTYRRILSEDDPVVLIPVGAIEQHGPHMPLSVDVLLSTTMAELTAERLGSALVGPTITTGYKSQQRSGGGNHIIGSFGFDAETVIGVCRTLVREFTRHGARRIVFVNGHYENYQFLYEGVDLALRELAPAGEPPQVMLLSYWDFVTEEVIARLYPDGFPGWDVEHGGVMETSLMLEYFPELVHMDRVMDLPAAELPLYDLLPVDASLTPESGCLSSAQAASAEKGQVLAASVIEGMTEAITSRFAV
ncbi:MAG: creatininase [Actinomyces sp.]|uniref:creatininase n=1 Tax=Actinomyces sp. TaxID=29317 RepID=UPI0026DAF7AC|nr:creatininase [Actinomyces sp.]MDO4244145.1 creatininase [Actinomyces sp.]